MEPWGTPDPTPHSSEALPSISTHCVLWSRKELNQEWTSPLMLSYSALWRRWWWGTWSNALEKSIMLTSYCCPSGRPFTSSCVKFNICISQDLLVLKSCWLSVRVHFLLGGSWFACQWCDRVVYMSANKYRKWAHSFLHLPMLLVWLLEELRGRVFSS